MGLKPRIAAIVVTLVDDGSVLLVRRRRSRFWSLPGDVIGFSEDIHDAAVRVIKEQAGYPVHFGGLVDLTTPAPGVLSVNVRARLVNPRTDPAPGGPVTAAAWHSSPPRGTLERHRDRIRRVFQSSS